MDFIFVKSTKEGMDGYGTVYARIRCADSVKKISIGYVIKKLEWEDYRSGKYAATKIIRSINLRYGVFANILEQIKGYLEEESDYTKAGYTINAIKQTVTSSMSREERKKKFVKKKAVLLLDFINEVKEEYTSGERLKMQTSEKVSKGTIHHYNYLINTLTKFETDCECRFTIDEIDLEWRQEFISWCMNKSLSTNSINSLMYMLHICLRIANETKVSKNEIYLVKGFVPKKDIVDHIYLIPERIKEMYELDLSSPKVIRKLADKANLEKYQITEMERQFRSRNPKSIEMTRDIFMVGCFTGQRLSNYSRISSEMITSIKGTRFIRLIQQKTGREVYIPLDKRVKRILDKYHGVLPYININTFNFNLKLIAELLGWTEEPGFDERSMKGKFGPRFCDMISSHTARRSFATNAYAAKVPLSSIMLITGHSSEEKLRVYLKLQIEEKAIIAAKELSKIMQTNIKD